jgi:hypothetical protein
MNYQCPICNKIYQNAGDMANCIIEDEKKGQVDEDRKKLYQIATLKNKINETYRTMCGYITEYNNLVDKESVCYSTLEFKSDEIQIKQPSKTKENSAAESNSKKEKTTRSKNKNSSNSKKDKNLGSFSIKINGKDLADKIIEIAESLPEDFTDEDLLKAIESLGIDFNKDGLSDLLFNWTL